MTLNYRELKRRYDVDGADRTVQHLSESLKEGHLKAEDFSIRDLAEALVPDGRQWVRLLDPRASGSVSVLEASEGVDVSAFLNVTGQVIYTKILEAYAQEAFVVSKLVQTIPTRLDGEKIPGISRVEEGRGRSCPWYALSRIWVSAKTTLKLRRLRNAASSCL